MKKGITGDQILQFDNPRKDKLLLGEYLAEGETLLLYAPTGHGKTITALELAIALTTGGSFYNWKAHKPIPVLFVEGGELTAYGIAERVKNIYKIQGITADPNFHLKAPTREEPFVFNVTDPAHQTVIYKYVVEYGIRCVVFDNFNSLRIDDGNEFIAWGQLEKFLNKLKTLGCSSVVIHHTNKEAKQQSGGQRKADYADCVVRIQKSRLSTKKGKNDTLGKVYIEFEMQKFRWGDSQDLTLSELCYTPAGLKLNPVDYQDILTKTIRKDLADYGIKYVRSKFDYLGYTLEHYIKVSDILEEARDEKQKNMFGEWEDL